MEQSIECIIVGGPQHGTICRRPWAADGSAQLRLATCDGLLCSAAARRHDRSGTRYILLHPTATGEQFLTMLAA